jgi:phage baseplate assembly protein V
MNRFLNVMKAHAAALDRSQGQPRFGTVTSVDPSRHVARVTLQPEGVLTGWLPVLSPWVGAGWGMASLPAPGMQVLVLPQEGDAEQGVIAGAAFSQATPPPAAPVGELWLVHQSGSSLKLTNDGTIHIQGNVVVNGTLTATDLLDGVGTLSRLRTHYNEHTHPGQVSVLPSPQD